MPSPKSRIDDVKEKRALMTIVQNQGPRGKLTVRLPDDLRKRVSQYAHDNHISVNQVILEILNREFFRKR